MILPPLEFANKHSLRYALHETWEERKIREGPGGVNEFLHLVQLAALHTLVFVFLSLRVRSFVISCNSNVLLDQFV